MTDQVTLTIDGREVTVPKGTLVVDAAEVGAGPEVGAFFFVVNKHQAIAG